MKFKAKDLIYVVWDYEHITKERISYVEKGYYIVDDSYADDKNSFGKLVEAKTYARKLLDKHILKVSRFIDNVKPKLDT